MPYLPTMTAPQWMGLFAVIVLGATLLVGRARTKRSERVLVQPVGSDPWSNSVAFALPEAVGAYTTALLSICALEGTSVILVEGRAVPRLESLTHDPDLVAWKAKLPHNYTDQLTSEHVMGFIIGFAKWPSPDDRVFSTELRAKVVNDGGVAVFTFKVNMTTVGTDQRRLEIRPADVGASNPLDSVESVSDS